MKYLASLEDYSIIKCVVDAVIGYILCVRFTARLSIEGLGICKTKLFSAYLSLTDFRQGPLSSVLAPFGAFFSGLLFQARGSCAETTSGLERCVAYI